MLRCNNNKDNEVTVTATPVATQDIDVTGTQDMDQTNTCDDDDLGIPGEIECINDFSNFLSVTSDGANSEVNLDTNTQQVSQENDSPKLSFNYIKIVYC
jgi:hypothetical protein